MTRPNPSVAFAQLPADATVEIYCPTLPLAVYREVSCHLRQCGGVEVDILPQLNKQFRYADSQTGGLRVRCKSDVGSRTWAQVEAILHYYGDRYGDWELISESR